MKPLPRTWVEYGQVAGAAFVRNALRAPLKLLIAGVLGPRALGIHRSVYALFKLVTSLADLALDYAGVTFVAAAAKRGDEVERRQVLAAVLGLKLLTIVALVAIGVAAGPWLARVALADSGLAGYARLAFVAAGGQLLWRYVSGYFSARQEFSRYSLFLTTVPVLMLVAAALLAWAGRLDLDAAVLIYLLAPLVTVVLWWPALERGLWRRPFADQGLIRRLVRFSAFVSATNSASAGRNHLGPLLLKQPALAGSAAAGEAGAGLFGFASDMAGEVTVFSQSLLTVMLPKASRKTDAERLRAFLKRSYVKMPLLLLPMALFLPAIEPATRLLGRLSPGYLEYLPSVPICALLYVGSLFSVAAVPMQTALYALRRPHVETWAELATLPLFIGGSCWAIPRWGGAGVAAIVLLQRLTTFLVIMSYGVACLRGLHGKIEGLAAPPGGEGAEG